MLATASVLYQGEAEPIEPVYVGFSQPDMQDFAGQQSKQYVMEYLHSDLPDLAEGDQVIIDNSAYIVRQPPTVNEEGGANGTFRKVLLTWTGPKC